MTLLGFKERFVPMIESRAKKHTIRAVPKDGKVRFKIGHPIQLYRRVRQKDSRKIIDIDPVCTKIEAITVDRGYERRVHISINGVLLTYEQSNQLARADGFPHLADFEAFFVPKPDDTFAGHIIHWDWK